jgi:hypothetical protein
MKFHTQSAFSSIVDLSSELEYDGPNVKCELIDRMYEMFKNIKKNRQNDCEFRAMQLERIIIAQHKNILTGLFTVLNRDDL